MVSELGDDSALQFSFLRSVLSAQKAEGTAGKSAGLNELYVTLLCQFDPNAVCDFLIETEVTAFRLRFHCRSSPR